MEGDNKNNCPSLTWSQSLKEVSSKLLPSSPSFPCPEGREGLGEVGRWRAGLRHQEQGGFTGKEEKPPHHPLTRSRAHGQLSLLADPDSSSITEPPPSSTIK